MMVSENLYKVVSQLCELYAVFSLLRDLGNFLVVSDRMLTEHSNVLLVSCTRITSRFLHYEFSLSRMFEFSFQRYTIE